MVAIVFAYRPNPASPSFTFAILPSLAYPTGLDTITGSGYESLGIFRNRETVVSDSQVHRKVPVYGWFADQLHVETSVRCTKRQGPQWDSIPARHTATCRY